MNDKEINKMFPLRPTDGTDEVVNYNTAILQARGGAKVMLELIKPSDDVIKQYVAEKYGYADWLQVEMVEFVSQNEYEGMKCKMKLEFNIIKEWSRINSY